MLCSLTLIFHEFILSQANHWYVFNCSMPYIVSHLVTNAEEYTSICPGSSVCDEFCRGQVFEVSALYALFSEKCTDLLMDAFYKMHAVMLFFCRPFGRLWGDETVHTVVTRAEPHNQVSFVISCLMF
jgi:hypothetical protein